MASTTITNTPSTADMPMWRKDKRGQFIQTEPNEKERELTTVPPKGRYRLKFTGISEPFESDDYFNPGQKKTETRVEFTIIRGKNLTGRRFTNRWTWSLNEKAKLHKFLVLVTGKQIESGSTIDVRDALGIEFDASVNPDGKDRYAPLVIDSIMTDEDEEDAQEAPDDTEDDDEDGAAVFGLRAR